jgi:hypothetical protein
MNKLIVICKEESQANHLAFLLGIPASSVLPFSDVKDIELINPEAVGGFVTYIEPYPDNVMELREVLRYSPIGDKLIKLTFDSSGRSKDMITVVNKIKQCLDNYNTVAYTDTALKLSSIKKQFRQMFDSFGMTLDKGFDFDLYESPQRNIILKEKSNPMELFLKLLIKYEND